MSKGRRKSTKIINTIISIVIIILLVVFGKEITNTKL